MRWCKKGYLKLDWKCSTRYEWAWLIAHADVCGMCILCVSVCLGCIFCAHLVFHAVAQKQMRNLC